MLSIARGKGVLNKLLNACFQWTFEYRRKRQVNKAIKKIALIENASVAYVFRDNYLKYSLVNFLSIFSSFKCLYVDRSEWNIVSSYSYGGWDKPGYTMWCSREGTSTHPNCVWLSAWSR